jgi:hypothetical protein
MDQDEAMNVAVEVFRQVFEPMGSSWQLLFLQGNCDPDKNGVWTVKLTYIYGTTGVPGAPQAGGRAAMYRTREDLHIMINPFDQTVKYSITTEQ